MSVKRAVYHSDDWMSKYSGEQRSYFVELLATPKFRGQRFFFIKQYYCYNEWDFTLDRGAN